MPPLHRAFAIIVCLSLLAGGVNGQIANGLTTVEAGSWSIRTAIRTTCDSSQPRAAYRACLAGSVTDDNKHRFVIFELSDPCADRRRCQIPDADVAKVKNCFNTVAVINRSLPNRPWHASLYEDVMVGCLSKERLKRVIRFSKTPNPGMPVVDVGPPFTEVMLRRLLSGAFRERKDLQERVVSMCTNFKQ